MSTAEGGGDIVRDGLVLLLDAANPKSYLSGSTTWTDLSRSGNNGSLINGPTFNSLNNGSIVFDGVNDYVLIPNGFTNCFKNKTFWTTSIWVKVNSWGGGNDAFPVLVSIGSGQGAYQELYLEIGNAGLFYFAFANNFTSGSLTINLNQYYNLVYMKNGTFFNVYSNGVLIYSASGFNNVSTVDGDLWIGRFKTEDFELNGNIPQISIYNRALSATEIQQNFNATRSRFGI